MTREDQRERKLRKDLDAYKELRANGTQPRKIDGCHDLAQRAETKAEIEAGIAAPSKKQQRQLKAVMGDPG